jgi:hypothetical protein
MITLSPFLSRATSNVQPSVPRHRLKLSQEAPEDRSVTSPNFVPQVVKE